MGSRSIYREGDWFVVPLAGGGYGLGRVARLDGIGTVLGYFFGPRRDAFPGEAELQDLGPGEAILVRMFGDLGLVRGEWSILGGAESWGESDSRWDMPVFGRHEEMSDRYWQVEYSDSNLSKPTRETQVSEEEVHLLPSDDLLGSGAVERLLAHLLA